MKKNTLAAIGITLSIVTAIGTGCGSTAAAASSTTSAAESSTTAEAADSSSSAEGSASDQQTPPDKPDGENGGPGKDGQAPPDLPDGQNGQGGPGGAPGQGGPGGADTQTYDYSGDLDGTLTADGEDKTSDSETISSSDADVNAVLVENSGTAKVTKATLTKSGDDTNGDNCNFYGLNSIVLSVGDGSTAYVSDSDLSADSEGSNAMFATDSGTIYANNDTIHTTAGNSRGLDATYGGTIIANKMDITTEGDHCASLATDRGGGNISVANSTLTTEGSGSPLLYSTGNIQVDNVTGTASGSQIAGMEGLNTILINNSSLTSTLTGKTASDPVADGIIIYQSTSGDAETTTGDKATFQAVDSTLKSAVKDGTMFYVTNTEANILLSNTTLDFDSDSSCLALIEGNDSNSWGSAGSNGADVTFTLDDEQVSGDIGVDTISSLDLYLQNGTTYTGAITITENEDADSSSETDTPVTVNLDSTSTWVVTGDSTISALNAAKGSGIVDENGKTVTIVANGKTVVKGSSSYTVTVTGTYTTDYTTDSDNTFVTDTIDRTAFNEYYGLS